MRAAAALAALALARGAAAACFVCQGGRVCERRQYGCAGHKRAHYTTAADCERHCGRRMVTDDIAAVAGQRWDYIVVGGGLAGLTVAARVSEDPAVRVLVVEAGGDDRGDPLIYNASGSMYGRTFGTNLTWSYPAGVGGVCGERCVIYGGRTLGGSSSINGAEWTRGAAAQYDALGGIGNAGWSYADLLGYMNKAERFCPPDPTQEAAGAGYNASTHGFAGAVRTRFVAFDDNTLASAIRGPQVPAFNESAQRALGLRSLPDLTTGAPTGVAMVQNTISCVDDRRSSSAEAYITPIEEARPNLAVLVTWLVARLTWAAPGRVAGVTVQQARGGLEYDLFAAREVIAAGGAVRSPLLLEHSGIGDPDVLRRVGVAPRVALPGVGRNLQEQTNGFVVTRTNGTEVHGAGPVNMLAMPAAKQLFRDAGAAVRARIDAEMAEWADAAVRDGAAVSAAALRAAWAAQARQLFDDGVPAAEMIFEPGAGATTVQLWTLVPLSRGFIHINSSDAFDAPAIEPRYFSVPTDMHFMVAALRAARKVLQAEPLQRMLSDEITPGLDRVPNGRFEKYGDYAAWEQYVKDTFATVIHPIGTCTMAPRALGGVTDPRFRVYGVENLRVVDASVLPLQVSAHLQSTLYGVAEKAAAIITEDRKNGDVRLQ